MAACAAMYITHCTMLSCMHVRTYGSTCVYQCIMLIPQCFHPVLVHIRTYESPQDSPSPLEDKGHGRITVKTYISYLYLGSGYVLGALIVALFVVSQVRLQKVLCKLYYYTILYLHMRYSYELSACKNFIVRPTRFLLIVVLLSPGQHCYDRVVAGTMVSLSCAFACKHPKLMVPKPLLWLLPLTPLDCLCLPFTMLLMQGSSKLHMPRIEQHWQHYHIQPPTRREVALLFQLTAVCW